MVRLSQRRETAKKVVQAGITSIADAFKTFDVGLTCHRYQAKACQENAVIAGWMIRLTSAYRIEQVQEIATLWLWIYSHEWPNLAVGGITPMQKLALAAQFHFWRRL